MRGSKRTEKAKMVHALAMGGSTREEGLPDDMMGIVFDLIGKSFDHDRPKLNDLRWTRTWELAVTQRVKARLHGPTSPAVLVLGLGTAVPPLAAARAGARVLWCLRVRRFYEIAARVVEVNGLHNQIQVLHRREAPSALGAVLGPQFDLLWPNKYCNQSKSYWYPKWDPTQTPKLRICAPMGHPMKAPHPPQSQHKNAS